MFFQIDATSPAKFIELIKEHRKLHAVCQTGCGKFKLKRFVIFWFSSFDSLK